MSNREERTAFPAPAKASCAEAFEDILEVINPQGKFQKTFLYAFLCPLCVISSLGTSFVYVFYIPKHWCRDPDWSQRFSSYDAWKNATIPSETSADGRVTFASCRMRIENGTELECQHGWDYDRSELEMTMPSEYDWVCDRQQYITIMFTVSGVAGILGTVILGPTIDKYGRRRIFVLLTLIDIIAGILRLFTPKYYFVFLAITVFNSFIGANADIIVLELTDSQFRSWINSTLYTVFVFGMAAVPAIIYFFPNWFHIALIAVLSRALFLLVAISCFYIPESPRWLISVGRTVEAKEVIRKVAKINGTLDKLQDAALDASLKRLSEGASNPAGYAPFLGMLQLLRKPKIALNSCLLAFVMAMNDFVYGGITLNTPYMPGNKLMAFFLLAIVEIPSSILGGYLMQVVGRRWTPAGFYTISAISCIVAAIHINSSLLVTICIIISKFSVNLTALVTCVQEVEIFPTQYRATGISFTAMLSQCLCLGMPAIINLGRQDESIPYYAFGVCSLIGILCSVNLPETLNQRLPETLEEANDFAKGQGFWTLRPKATDHPSGSKERSSAVPLTSIKRPPSVRDRARGSVRRTSVVSYMSVK